MKIQTAVEEVGAGPMHVPDTCIYMYLVYVPVALLLFVYTSFFVM